MVGSVLRVRYELTQLLNEGPIFTTYAARDRLQGNEICVRVIKEPFASEGDFVQQIQEVVKRYSVVDHPGVEAMLQVDDDAGTPFLISDLSKGQPLADRIKKLAPFSVPVAVSTAISLCEGLEALHRMGLAHGDVSSQNLIALPDGQIRVQLPGLWQAYACSPEAANIALPSMSPYLAPEVGSGAMPSPASDVYSAGVLLYELLTGRLPYNADNPAAMALKHATSPVPTVRMYNPSVPNVLDEIVKRALAKEPSARYRSAGALLSDLRVLQDALRFGRTVTWPISTDPADTTFKTMPNKSNPRKEGSAAPAPRVKVERDVPLYLWIPIAMVGAAAATLVGIYIYFNATKPAEVKLPSLGGLTIADARNTLRPLKLDLEVDGHKPSDEVPVDSILSSDPQSGQLMREGSRVHVIVSSGSGKAEVPDLKGISVDQARATLAEDHLELDESIETKPSKSVESGLIMGQVPAPGKKIAQGTKVKVTISSGPPPDQGETGGGEPTVPPATQTNLYRLKVKLSNLTKPVMVRIDIVDDLGVHTVQDATEGQPGDTISFATRGTGKKVTFRIYYDDVLVKEVTQRAKDATPVSPGDTNDIQ